MRCEPSSLWATGCHQSVDRGAAGACMQGITAMAVDPVAVAGVRRQPPRVALATKPSRKTVQVAVHLLAAGEQGAAAYGAPSSLAAHADLESRLPVQVGGTARLPTLHVLPATHRGRQHTTRRIHTNPALLSAARDGFDSWTAGRLSRQCDARASPCAAWDAVCGAPQICRAARGLYCARPFPRRCGPG